MPGEPGTRSLGCEPDEAQGYDRNGNQEAFSGGFLYSHGEKAYNGGRENLSEDEKGRTGSISLQGGWSSGTMTTDMDMANVLCAFDFSAKPDCPGSPGNPGDLILTEASVWMT